MKKIANPAEKKRKTLIAAARRKLSSSNKRCPRCRKMKPITAFGWRTMKSDRRGLPLLVRPQSHCGECRGT